MREEHARVQADAASSQAHRAEQLKRLDGIATILAKTAVRDPALLALLAEDAVVSDAARSLKRDMLRAAGIEPAPEETAPPEPAAAPRRAPSGGSCRSRSSRGSWPTRSSPPTSPPPGRATVRPRRLAGWELLGPLLSSFERAGGGAPACMALPAPASLRAPGRPGADAAPGAGGRRGRGRPPDLPARRRAGPGQDGAGAARRARRRTPTRCWWSCRTSSRPTGRARPACGRRTARPPSIHGNGETVDGFADIVVVNYEVLDRHVGWFGDFGFRGMVVDEAHFIKNKTSQRSQHVLELSERIRSRTARPLLMALTGTPLINDIEDFRAIWQFLGWIDESKPLAELMDALEETGLTPADPGFYPAARQCVIDLGIVRRRKVDVAADIPARRIADLPVELDDKAGRSIRAAERDLARRLVARYETRAGDPPVRRRRRGHRPRPRAPGGHVGAEGRDHDRDRRERVQHDAAHRPGEGRPRRRLRGPARPQRRQGGLLRQARRRHGRRRGDLRPARASGSRRSAATRRRRSRQKNIDAFVNDPGRRRSRSAR